MNQSKQSPPIRRAGGHQQITMLVLRAILLSLSFVLSALDHSLPSFVPGVPGMSLGLANVVVLFALLFLNWKDAVFITVTKSIFVFFLRGPVSLLLSVSGGLLALFVEILLWKLSRGKVSLMLLSAAGAMSHNVGQIIAYALYARVAVWILIPPLAVMGIVSGVITAIVLKAIYPFMERWFRTHRSYEGEGTQ
ncbi:MAG: Gx transporter family protein [Clostridiaceae bacterium]|nr:Gx transporter family protein [Clostridiaceae bacterium]